MRHNFIKIVRKAIINKFDRGNPSTWKHGDFESLSYEIFIATKERISSKTLKRIFGKDKTEKSYKPNNETVKILCEYAGITYEDDLAFHKEMILVRYKYISLVLIVLFVSSIVYINKTRKITGTTERANIELFQITGTVPWSAYFKVKIPETKDSVFVHFGDKQSKVYIEHGKELISHLYNYPDIFKVFISSGEKVISDTITVYGSTNSWLSLGYLDEIRDKVYPIPFAKSVNEGIFHPSNKVLNYSGLDTNSFLITNLYNFGNFSFSGDTFIIETRIRNTNFWPGDACHGVLIKLQSPLGMHKFHFNNKGCGFWLENIFSEVVYDGEEALNEQFNVEFFNWRVLRIENKGMHLSIFIDDQLIHDQLYEKAIGNIVGIHYKFIGNGWIDYLRISNLKGELIYTEEFNSK